MKLEHNGQTLELIFNTFATKRICELLKLDHPIEVFSRGKLTFDDYLKLIQAGLEGPVLEEMPEKDVYKAIDAFGAYSSIEWNNVFTELRKVIIPDELMEKLKGTAKEDAKEDAPAKKKPVGRK